MAGAVLVEAHDEWQVTAERRYLSERSMALLAEKKTQEEVAKPELMTASSDPLTRTVSGTPPTSGTSPTERVYRRPGKEQSHPIGL